MQEVPQILDRQKRLVGFYVSLKVKSKVPVFAALAAGIFAIQAMNIPIPWGTSGHMLGSVMAAIILGSPFAGILILALVLIVKGFLFGDGGMGKKIDIKINDKVLETRKKGYEFLVLFTNHQRLSAEELIGIYKSTDIVEQGFRALKSDLEIDPVYHSRDDRIETYTVMVVFGYLLMSLLNVALNERKISYSFVELKELIRSGNAVEGFYDFDVKESIPTDL